MMTSKIIKMVLDGLWAVWSFLCKILHYVSPLLLAAALTLGWLLDSTKDKVTSLEGQIKTLEVQIEARDNTIKRLNLQRALEGGIALENQTKKANNAEKACKDIGTFRQAAAACKCEAGTVNVNPLTQELPDEVLKGLDPSYSPK